MAQSMGRYVSKMTQALKVLNYRGVKNMKFKFDPYHDGSRSVKELVYMLHSPKLLKTNPSIGVKIDIKSDMSEPHMEVSFIDGEKVIFKTLNLSTMEVMERLAQFCVEKDPKKDAKEVIETGKPKKGKATKR